MFNFIPCQWPLTLPEPEIIFKKSYDVQGKCIFQLLNITPDSLICTDLNEFNELTGELIIINRIRVNDTEDWRCIGQWRLDKVIFAVGEIVDSLKWDLNNLT